MFRIIFTILALLSSVAASATCFLSGVVDQYTYFVAVDSTDFTTRETGLSGFTVYRSRNGAAAAAFTTPTINETDVTNMPGVYELLLDEDMTIDSGDDYQDMTVHITVSGMAPVTKEICIQRPKGTAGETITVASGVASADAVAISGDSTAANNLEALLDLIAGSNGAFAPFGIVATGTAQAYTSGTPSVTLAASTAAADDDFNGNTILVVGSNEGDWQSATINDYAGASDIATIDAALTTAPTGTISYIVFGTAEGAAGSLTAAEVVDEWETQSQADPTGFHVNVLEIGGTAQTANDNGADINSILDDTGTSGVVLANDAISDTKIAASAIGASEVATGAFDADAVAADAAAEIVAAHLVEQRSLTGTCDSGSTTTCVDDALTQAAEAQLDDRLICFDDLWCGMITGFTPGTDTATTTKVAPSTRASKAYTIFPATVE